MESKIKLLYITNIPTPYRNKRFNVMEKIFSQYNIDFTVEYMAWTEPNRFWTFNENDFNYKYNVNKGIHPTIGHMFAHFNLGFLFRLLKNNYDLAVVGGFGCPTHWLSPFFISSKKLKILSVESNLDSMTVKKGIGLKLKNVLINKYDGFQITGDKSKKYLNWINKGAKNKRFITFPNLIDENVFIDKVDQKKTYITNIRDNYNVGEHEQLWICPARLNKVKGLHLFLQNLKGVQNVKLIVAGEGELKEELL